MTGLLLTILILAEPAPMTLDDCIRAALTKHPDLALSRMDLHRAEAQKKGTRAGYLPHLDLGFQDGYYFWGEREFIYGFGGDPIEFTQPGGDDDTHSLSLRLSQNIFDGGKWWNQIERANREIDRTRLGIRTSTEGVALNVIVAFYELLKAHRELEVLQQGLESSQAQLSLARERKLLGAASKVDISRARVSVGEDRIAIEHQHRAVASAMVELNLAMGRAPTRPVVLTETGHEPAPGRLPGETQPFADHALLRQFQAAKDVADLNVSIARGDHWPRVSGSVVYSRQDPEFYKVYSRFDQLYNLTFLLTISLPVFDGFLTTSSIEQAEVEAGRVRVQEKKARQELEARLARAVSDLRRLQAVSRIEADNIQAAEQQLDLARESYKVGQGTALELRDAQLTVTRARLTAVKTQYELKMALAVYHQARGDLLGTYLSEEDR